MASSYICQDARKLGPSITDYDLIAVTSDHFGVTQEVAFTTRHNLKIFL